MEEGLDRNINKNKAAISKQIQFYYTVEKKFVKPSLAVRSTVSLCYRQTKNRVLFFVEAPVMSKACVRTIGMFTKYLKTTSTYPFYFVISQKQTLEFVPVAYSKCSLCNSCYPYIRIPVTVSVLTVSVNMSMCNYHLHLKTKGSVSGTQYSIKTAW